jgi:putative flippase GtrA
MKWLMNKLGVQNKTDLYKLLWQFFKFGLVGVSNTAVSLGVYYLVLWMNPDLYMLGSVLGTILSIFNAFIWNDLFVFTGNPKDFKSVMKRLGKTYVSYGGTSALSTALLWVEVELLFVSELYAPIINLVITIPLNYLINKFWTFKSK